MPATLRPRFALAVPLPPDEVIGRLQRRLAEADCPFAGSVAAGLRHADLRLRPEDARPWSPHLGLEVVPDGEDSRPDCLVGPNPGLWTFVAFGLLGSATAAAFLFVLGAVQLLLEEPAWGLAAGGAALALLALIWLGGRAGRRLAEPQTRLLCYFLEEAVSTGRTRPRPESGQVPWTLRSGHDLTGSDFASAGLDRGVPGGVERTEREGTK